MRPPLERLGGFLPAGIALALPIVFIPNAVDSYILPRVAIVIAGAGLGLGLALLLPGGPRLGPIQWPLAAASAAALLAFAFSVSWPVSLMGSYTRYESLPIRLSYLALLAIPVWLLRDQRSRDRVVAAFVFGTCIASIQALLQQIQLSSHLIDFRPDGNLGNANLLGALLAMAIPLAVARGLRGGRFVVAWWLGILVMVGALLASTSRSGGLGALAGCLVLAVFGFRDRRKALVGALVSAAIVGVALLAILLSPLRLLNDDPGPSRLHLWPDAIRMIEARPLTGWGEDTTGLVYGQFLSGDWAPQVDRAHSGPLDVAATEGMLGLAALGWVLLVWLRGVWRRRLNPSVAPLAAACIGYSVWVAFNFDWAPATAGFWLLAGTAWAALRADESQGETVVEPAQRARGIALRSVVAVGLAAAVVGLGVMPLLADIWYAGGRPDLSVAAAPLQGRYHWVYGARLVAGGSPSRGLGEMQLAAGLGESDPQLYVDIGDAQQGLGRTAEAEAAYRMALKIDPFYRPARQRLAGKGLPASG